ncbi:MAG: thiolase family protein [Candidatus Dormibacterales bacterium]
MAELQEAVVVSAVRTPMGRYGGQLKDVRPDDLGAIVIAEAARRAGVEPADVEDVVFGCANQAGEDNRNVARMALLLAGFPVEVPGQTVNRLCGSGMQAAVTAAMQIQAGGARVLVAGGVESMSRSPWVMAKPEGSRPRGAQTLYDTALGWRLVNPRMQALYGTAAMGETAENVAEAYSVTRADQDAFALESHRRAVAAQDAGRFQEEVVPVRLTGRDGAAVTVTADEGPRRDTSMEALGALRAAFREGGTVTAGNSSPLNDGAAALVLMSATEARRRGLRPLARFQGGAAAGVHPDHMGMGPVPATRKLLACAGVAPSEVGLVELNEAFAAQAVACTRELGLEAGRVNVNGGAIALGHPLGCSGARLITTLVHEMGRRQQELGLATMCIGVGQGISSLWRLP